MEGRNSLKRIACVVGLAVIILTSCSKADESVAEITIPKKIEWKEKKVQVDKTEYVQKYAECMTTSYDGVYYHFAKDSFKESNSTKFTKVIMELVEYADTILQKKEERRKDIFLNVSEVKEKLEVSEKFNFDTVWKVLEKIEKVDCAEQYGLFYLYSINRGLLEDRRSATEEELKTFFGDEDNLYLMDFCVPMLEEKFFSEKQARMTRAAVESFAMWYVEKYSYQGYEKLCKNIEMTDRKKLEKDKNEWLKSIGCKTSYKELYKINFKPSTKRRSYQYMSGGVVQEKDICGDYEVECDDVFWVWKRDEVKELGYKKLVEGYKKIEPLRKKDFAEAREFLRDYLPDEVGKVDIYINFLDQRDNYAGVYDIGKGIVLKYGWLDAGDCLLHEYCHFLTLGQNRMIPVDYGVFSEWLAEWVSCIELKNREWDRDETYYERYLKSQKKEDVYLSGLSYEDRAVMCKYIYETYGMKKLAELVKTDGEFETVLGISLEQIYENAYEFAKEQVK